MTTSKQILLATLRGQERDRMAWAPFLTYWWDFNRVRQAETKGELGFKRSVGCDLLMRGHYDRPSHNVYRDMFTFRARYEKTRVEETVRDGKKYQRYVTPVGELTAVYSYSASGDTWFLTGHPVREERDFDVLEYVMRDRVLEADGEYLDALQADPDALFLPLITPLTKTGFQSMIEYWVGTEEMAYALADYPEQVEKALRAMWQLSEQGAKLSADSQAEAFLSWEDSSTTNVSPNWYGRYILPEINRWCEIVHAKGKMYVQHACGHLRALAPLIAQSSIDALESVSAPPTGNITPVEMRQILPERITVIGGIEPTFFEGASDEELALMLIEQFDCVKGQRFILANADSCPPGVDVNRFGFVTRVIREACGARVPSIEIFDANDMIASRGAGAYHGSAAAQ